MAKSKNYPISNTQNSVVRSILNNISEKIGTLDSGTMENILKYFNYKCAYTGNKLKKDDIAFDHLIPCNRQYGGLYLAGNLVPTSKKINNKKGGKHFIDFLNDEKNDIIPKEKKQETIERLKKYQRDFEYPENIVNKDFINRLSEIYSEVEGIINTYVLEFLYSESTPKEEDKTSYIGKNSLALLEKNLITNEKFKITRRIPKWFKNTNQQNSILLRTFLRLNEELKEVSVQKLKDEVNKEIGFNKNFDSNFTPMTKIYKNNHGKVFEIYNKNGIEIVKLWSDIENFILEEYKKYKNINHS